ncbi:MAG: DUF373 family protein [Thaumarchaeota archaeon]|nr:DUF373 family protein [Nitrososphaerota archaeon]
MKKKPALLEGKSTKLLVICVDRDDDVGRKAKARTPVQGRDACVDLATKLAIADPEEADANAIFAAVKLNDDLQLKGHSSEVAVVAGLHHGGFEADQKLRRELMKVLNGYKAEGAILVSDGVDDNDIVPLVQGLVPIVSLRRVVIKHSAGLEETYAVLGRYLRMLIYDTRYSRFALGVPGLILITWALLALLQLLSQAITVTLAILGAALAIRGFDLDRLSLSLSRLKLSGYVRLFSFFAGILTIGVGAFQGFSSLGGTTQYAEVVADPPKFFTFGPMLVGTFMSNALLPIWIGIGLFIIGGILSNWIRVKDLNVIRNSIALLILGFLYLPVQQFALILTGFGSVFTLMSSLLLGLVSTFVIVVLMYSRLRRT